MKKKQLVFVSPRCLFPADSGGKIRTSQVLRGMKGGGFEITLVSPASPGAKERFAAELECVADRFYSWPEPRRGRVFRLMRMCHLLSDVPIPVRTDYSKHGRSVVQAALANAPDLVVFDFLHSAVLAPPRITVPSVLFTHNIEAEIFRRHVQVAPNFLLRAIWRNQLAKMERFEKQTLHRFDSVVAVSDRDKTYFEEQHEAKNVSLIRTGVDLDYFSYVPPTSEQTVVFMGAMDWLANIDGIRYFMEEIWPLIARQCPSAKMLVVGHSPPSFLSKRVQSLGWPWTFTGFVEDVRPYIRKACVFVIPLRVGSGTRIKVFEAMAMGCPVVSTTIGVEGLPLENGQHYLAADSPADFARATVRLLQDSTLRARLSAEARAHVQRHFSSTAAAQDFEEICQRVAGTLGKAATKRSRLG